MKSKFILQMYCYRHCTISNASFLSVYHRVRGPPTAIEKYIYGLNIENTFLAQQLSCSAWQDVM